MKVLFPVAEAYPLYKIGGLGDVGGSLPLALAKLGCEVAVVLPQHPEINTQGFSSVVNFELNYDHKSLKVDFLKGKLGQSQVTVYLVSESEYLSQHTDASDNHADKFAVFDLAVAHFLNHHQQEFKADVVHLHDWHASLIPTFVKKLYHNHDYRYMLTIHNLAYQGRTNTPVLNKAGLNDADITTAYQLTNDHHLNILLQGIVESDMIIPVSPTYAQEILTLEYGEKLEIHLLAHQTKIKGILNGLDLELFNPTIDPHLFNQYTRESVLEIRPGNKQKLLEHIGMEYRENRYLVGYVGRVDGHQKGIQIIIDALATGVFDDQDRDFVFLGTGEPELEKLLHVAAEGKTNVKVFTKYDEELAIRIYAGADSMIIPSKFEPCGLVQMIAMRYGAVPIARKTGGLADTIIDGQDGFLFADYSTQDLQETINKSQEIYADKARWNQLIMAGMAKDFSWDTSAQVYLDTYVSMLHRNM